MIKNDKAFLTQGSFAIGCNYWASHSGTKMWSEWRPDIVNKDLKLLSKKGIAIIRIFLLWPDFQPLTMLRWAGGKPIELSHGDEFLSCDTEEGRAGISIEAMEHFDDFTYIAEKQGVKLIVGLITGWMSGRWFVPPVLEDKNPITDPLAIMLETRFVKYFVNRFKDKQSILAWDLGNECNVMGSATREQAWVWTSTITSAIRMFDQSRQIISGMHSLGISNEWRIEDQAENCDILTTHPYPIWTKFVDYEPLNSMRCILHSTAETCFYADIGRKPCIIEEIGVGNPMLGSDEYVPKFVRPAMFSAWAHDARALLWWCANDQTELKHAPYDWYSCERELGLLKTNGNSKPVLDEMEKFQKFIDALNFKQLPLRHIDAVCILSKEQEHWPVLYGSFMLAKQAGMDIEFQYVEQELKDSSLYLLPCINGLQVINRRTWIKLLEKVRNGATLFISIENGLLSWMEELLGVRFKARRKCDGIQNLSLEYIKVGLNLNFNRDYRFTLVPDGAEVLGTDQDGNPAFIHNHYGKGNVYFLDAPLEKEAALYSGLFSEQNMPEYWRIYKAIASKEISLRFAKKINPGTGITEHDFGHGVKVIIAINYNETPVFEEITITQGWRLTDIIYGSKGIFRDSVFTIEIGGNDAAVFMIKSN